MVRGGPALYSDRQPPQPEPPLPPTSRIKKKKDCPSFPFLLSPPAPPAYVPARDAIGSVSGRLRSVAPCCLSTPHAPAVDPPYYCCCCCRCCADATSFDGYIYRPQCPMLAAAVLLLYYCSSCCLENPSTMFRSLESLPSPTTGFVILPIPFRQNPDCPGILTFWSPPHGGVLIH